MTSPYDMPPPAGDCAHCGEAVSESRLFEFTYGGGQRPVTILVHTESCHERCEGRETLAERDRSASPGSTPGGTSRPS